MNVLVLEIIENQGNPSSLCGMRTVESQGLPSLLFGRWFKIKRKQKCDVIEH